MVSVPGGAGDVHELNEIWDDERSGEVEDVGAGGIAMPGRHPSFGAGGSTPHSQHLATISEPGEEGEEARAADSDGGSVSRADDTDDGPEQTRFGGLAQSLSGGYLASLAGGGGGSAATTPLQQPYGAPASSRPTPTPSAGIGMAIPSSGRGGFPSYGGGLDGSPTGGGLGAGASAQVQLGTSAPIAIPMSAGARRFGGGGGGGAGERRVSSTFVPPHLMEQQQRFAGEDGALPGGGALTFSGIVSPAASLKRDRLVQRNAILRSTGFIEGAPPGAAHATFAGGFAETLDPIKESQIGTAVGAGAGLGVDGAGLGLGSGGSGASAGLGGIAAAAAAGAFPERPVGASALSRALGGDAATPTPTTAV